MTFIGGDFCRAFLELEGPGAVTVDSGVPRTDEYRSGGVITIAPGKSYDIKISSLASGICDTSQYSYWTEPGEYTLTACLFYLVPGRSARSLRDNGLPAEFAVRTGPAKLKISAA